MQEIQFKSDGWKGFWMILACFYIMFVSTSVALVEFTPTYSLHQQADQPCEAANDDASQNSLIEDDDFKLFEIHRIKSLRSWTYRDARRLSWQCFQAQDRLCDVLTKNTHWARWILWLNSFGLARRVTFCCARRMSSNVAFGRLPESGAARILHVALWSEVKLPPKFIVVELQLLIQIMKSDDQMHRNYAAMRDKMTN